MKKQLVTAVGAVFAAGTLAAGALAWRSSNAAPAPTGPQAIPVAVATVLESEVSTWESFSGRLEAVERVDVRSRVAGAVQAVHFREGAMVNAGDLLVTIDPAPYAADVDRAQAQVVAAQARLDHATSEHERAKRLWQESAIAQRELDERVNLRQEAEANLRAAEAALRIARLNLGWTQVRAPVAGRVGRLEITVGNLVAAGPSAPVLTTLVSVDPIYASFDADEQVVARALKDLPGGSRSRLSAIPVRMGTAADGDTPFEGRMQLVDNQVNARNGTVRVRAVFENDDGTLMPGQFAQVRLGSPKPAKSLLVSERAVGTDQSRRFVLVVGEDNKVAYREVTLGPAVDGLRIVSSGLKPGERIVVNGLQRVRPGAVVDPQPAQMAARTGAAPRS